MYERFYQLRERPFALAPDPDYLYRSRLHTTALSRLREGLANGAGLTVLTGEIGSGKTTLLHTLARELPPATSVCWIVNTQLDAQELVEAIVLGFGLEPRPNVSEARLIEHLARFLSDEQWVGRQTLLIIDEAQNLGLIALDRLLTALEDAGAPLPRVVLVGQPSLADLLRTKELEGLRRRTRISHHLFGLDATDTAAYINHRLGHAALGVATGFSEAAARLIHQHSEGIPRRINILCDTVLLHGYGEGRPAIDLDIARRVLADLERTGTSEPADSTGADAGPVNRQDLVPVRTETPSPEELPAAAEVQESPSESWLSLAGAMSWLETPSRLRQASVRPAIARLLTGAATERDERVRLAVAGVAAILVTTFVAAIYIFMKSQVHDAAVVLWPSAPVQSHAAPALRPVPSPESGEPDRRAVRAEAPAARSEPPVARTEPPAARSGLPAAAARAPASSPGAAPRSGPQPVSLVSDGRATVKPGASLPGPPARQGPPATSRGTVDSAIATAGNSRAALQPVPAPSVEAPAVGPEPPSGPAIPMVLRVPTAEIPAATMRPAPPSSPLSSPPPNPSASPPSSPPSNASSSPPPAAAPAPAAAVPVASVDERSVRAVVNQYRSAFSALNAAAAKAVWPSVDERTLSRAFSQLESQDFRFDGCQISVRGNRALAVCSGDARFVPRVGDRTPRQEPRLWTFDLQKSNSAWTIQRVEAR